ncbi:hypothetical protein ORI20_28890 [Mycobacterium sp. CVI_P3]|uniref:DUF7065 domain-containing protein n=1 Tax=Mycobacterium pinniadriaticum TaxID=2994102 RepID=A0ABT3SNE7_9MYCO|nr:hypothetical protein [Mycobacterium pinniadriaticum]MCX2934288.1 hypothetical protein [Mycobacterium pinniadriaticum]MCX2940674.1 hypothetical protein [Mycobacterium pinniadriaticum]
MIGPEDDSLHDPGEELYWNESAWFPISIPERLLSGWVMVFHRPNMKLSVGGIALWDPSGENPYDCLYYDWGDLWAFHPSWDMFDCALPNGLTVRMVAPLREFSITYDGNGCRADLSWTATAEPFHSKWSNGSADAWGSGHFEQPGLMTGTITLGGERLEVRCRSNRDHSWGPRHPKQIPRADFPWGLDDNGDGFHLFVVADQPPDRDPIDGTTETLLFGWRRADGVTSPLVTGERRVVERGPDGRPLRLQLRGIDQLGRQLIADGECVNWLRWQGYPFTFQWWCMVRWDIDGSPAWGELQEFYPLQQSREYFRAERDSSVIGS